MTLEEQFARLVADAAYTNMRPIPDLLRPTMTMPSARTRTVYSVGEAINQKGSGQNAKLGAGSLGDQDARR